MDTQAKTFDQELCEAMPRINTYARRFCKNDSDALDLVQLTLEKALRYRSSYTTGTNMKGWLAVIMKNTYFNLYRKKQSQSAGMEALHDAPKTHTEFEEDVQGHLDAQGLLNLLELHMSDLFFEVLRMCDYKGMPYAQIAAELDTPIGTVMSRLHRGRKQARDILLTHADAGTLEAYNLA
jgi:RNA polymerase sigma-70 factor (ECF subfamily)